MDNTENGIVSVAELKQKLEIQILDTFTTAKELQQRGEYAMHVVMNGILTVADNLPDKKLSNAIRKSLYSKGSTPEIVSQDKSSFKRNLSAPQYGTHKIVKPTELEEESSAAVEDRFTAKPYGADILEKKTVPAVDNIE